jgi:hypothetical protein
MDAVLQQRKGLERYPFFAAGKKRYKRKARSGAAGCAQNTQNQN